MRGIGKFMFRRDSYRTYKVVNWSKEKQKPQDVSCGPGRKTKK